MTSKVKELVEAAKRAQVLLRAVTVRRVLEAGSDVIEASGLNPWCINEGRATGSESIDAWWLEPAISAVESEGDGWIEIKDGCEMPEKSLDVYVLARFTEEFLSTPGLYNRRPAEVVSGNYFHMNTRIYSHWQPLPAPPTKEGR